jgi:hypothetical protein
MRWLAAFVLAAALAGCGSPSADLFVVKRSGADREANLTLLVSDDGSVTCNGRKHTISGDELLKARSLTRALEKQAQLHLALPPGADPILSYSVRMQAGTVSFADTSRPLPQSFAELTAFTSDVAKNACGINRN